ncbi:unnamed protein product [Prunus armeniaca]
MTVCQDQKTSNPKRKPLHCTYCDVDHHTNETCWKLNGYPLGHRLHKAGETNTVMGLPLQIKLAPTHLFKRFKPPCLICRHDSLNKFMPC